VHIVSSESEIVDEVVFVSAQILISKCLGRRFCEECGKNFNVADIYIPESGLHPLCVSHTAMVVKQAVLTIQAVA
jgi:hypothetical protein